MMKSSLAIFWMDFAATNAFFSAVEIIIIIISLEINAVAIHLFGKGHVQAGIVIAIVFMSLLMTQREN